MVLIISMPLEPSTDKVIDWLYYKKVSFQRIDGLDIVTPKFPFHVTLDNKGYAVCLDADQEISGEQLQSVWYRRDGTYDVENGITSLSALRDEPFFGAIKRNLNNEYKAGKRAFYACLGGSRKVLGNFNKSSVNKIEVLSAAREFGIDVPATLITTKKSELLKFVAKHGPVITKAIWESIGFSINKGNSIESFLNFTEVISEDSLASISDRFYVSLFQEHLEKELDLRVFYLNGECYSMAIFSQLDSKTKTDFRKYSNNRNVPYRLPSDLEQRIDQLMKSLELNTGSIDIVKTTGGRLVFLEVNPVGQYDMTSMPCNYRLDKKIAEYLLA